MPATLRDVEGVDPTRTADQAARSGMRAAVTILVLAASLAVAACDRKSTLYLEPGKQGAPPRSAPDNHKKNPPKSEPAPPATTPQDQDRRPPARRD